jgi:tRNA pseudouridine32 synthase / 23S rRNA pseudouridine746 synthase
MDLQKRLLYRDGLVLVVDKPAGINVHKGPKGGPALEDYFDQLQFGLPRKPTLAHRLDKETSGCLALGRHPKALRKLGKIFAEGQAQKIYWAICKGAPKQAQGLIDLPLYKDKTGRIHKMRSGDPEKAKPAQTEWKLLAEQNGLSFIECKPLTGRTHQIRVHLANLGCPILGDGLYGEASDTSMMLHARSLTLPLSKNKPPVEVIAEPPDEMAKMLAELK